ncbi:MAG: L-ribulose-5-phosphate 3-epimerase [Clostridiales bacterium]|nr:L-ribulose-5-phosphate 3-epimerase [Clostridiales bacterium]
MSLKNNRFGIYEKAIPNRFEWQDKIDIAISAGYDFIEMSVDESDERLSRLDWSKDTCAALRKTLFEADFYINSMCLSAHRRFPFGSEDKTKRKRAYEIMEKAINLSEALGIRNIQLAGYDVYYEDQSDETEERFIEGLKYAAKLASEANIMLSIEIMDTEFIGTITRCLKYIELVNSPWLKIYPDLGNLSQWTTNPSEELIKGFEHIVSIHLKDTRPNIFKCVPFGEGTVEFKGLFETLTEKEYSGPFLIEMWADNTLIETKEETVQHIVKAKEWLKQKM